MNSLVFLIPLSIVLLVGAGVALFWAVDHGQFDDLETPGLLPLFDVDERATDSSPCDANAAVTDSERNSPP
jgi:cbb3-type cytochrome oxidase maturation protein